MVTMEEGEGLKRRFTQNILRVAAVMIESYYFKLGSIELALSSVPAAGGC